MASTKKAAPGHKSVTYVGPHNEVEVGVLRGRRFQHGVPAEVPEEIADRLAEQGDWSLSGEAKVVAKHKASLKRVTEAESNTDPDEGPVYRAEQNDPDEQPEALYVEPDLETGDPNPSPDADHLDEQPDEEKDGNS